MVQRDAVVPHRPPGVRRPHGSQVPPLFPGQAYQVGVRQEIIPEARRCPPPDVKDHRQCRTVSAVPYSSSSSNESVEVPPASTSTAGLGASGTSAAGTSAAGTGAAGLSASPSGGGGPLGDFLHPVRAAMYYAPISGPELDRRFK